MNRFWDDILIPLLSGAALIAFVMFASNAHSAEVDDNAQSRPTIGERIAGLPKTEWVFDAALAADMMTTLDIRHHPGYYEQNPILGQHPSDAKVIGYVALSAALHAFITNEMVTEHVPMPIIQTWEAGSIAIEVGCAAHNYHIGLRFRL